jgi:hypothetical protein
MGPLNRTRLGLIRISHLRYRRTRSNFFRCRMGFVRTLPQLAWSQYASWLIPAPLTPSEIPHPLLHHTV